MKDETHTFDSFGLSSKIAAARKCPAICGERLPHSDVRGRSAFK